VMMNGVFCGAEPDLSSTSDTYSLALEANALASVPEEISLSRNKVIGCSTFDDVCQSSRDFDVTSVVEQETKLLQTDTSFFSDHSTVPFPSCPEANDLSNNSASTTLPLTIVHADDSHDASISSLQCAEINGDFSVCQLSSSSQEASSLSFFNSGVAQYSSLMPEVGLTAITPTEHCELRPEGVRWLYRDSAARQKKWWPFIGYDSLRIECKFRETRASRLNENSLSHDGNAADELVIVRGGLYEVDVILKTCVPIYWTAEG